MKEKNRRTIKKNGKRQRIDRMNLRYEDVIHSQSFMDLDLVFSIEEKNSLHYYQGKQSIDHIILSGAKQSLQDFYSVNNAYEVLNTLLYPGLSNERVRIIDEQRILNPILLDNMLETLKQYEYIASAIYKYTYMIENCTGIKVNRFDREDSIRVLESGSNCALMSATMAPDLEYFHSKSGLVIEKIDAPAYIEHINMNEVLGWDNELSHEEEILFPPFMKVRLEQTDLDEEEKTYLDCKGDPPSRKYLLHIVGSGIETINPLELKECNEQIEILKQEIIQQADIDNAKEVWLSLQDNRNPCKKQEEQYLVWKEKIQKYVKLVFQKEKGRIEKQKNILRKYITFRRELQESVNDHNEKRNKYSRCVEFAGVTTYICNALVSACLALSFINNDIFQTSIKSAGVIIVLFSYSIAGICKGLSWEDKLTQRTSTYLRLDELMREVRYENEINEDKLNQYIVKLKEILKADDLRCENNVENAIVHLDSLINKSESDI